MDNSINDALPESINVTFDVPYLSFSAKRLIECYGDGIVSRYAQLAPITTLELAYIDTYATIDEAKTDELANDAVYFIEPDGFVFLFRKSYMQLVRSDAYKR